MFCQKWNVHEYLDRALLQTASCWPLPLLASQPALAQTTGPAGLTGIQIDTWSRSTRPQADLRAAEEAPGPGAIQGVHVAVETERGRSTCRCRSAAFPTPFIAMAGSRIATSWSPRWRTTVAATNVLPGFRREDALVGGFVSTLLHETGHAIFYLLDIPIFGREEDAADAIAAYVAFSSETDRAPDNDRHGVCLARCRNCARQRGRPPAALKTTPTSTAPTRSASTTRFASRSDSDMVEKTTVFSDFVVAAARTAAAAIVHANIST